MGPVRELEILFDIVGIRWLNNNLGMIFGNEQTKSLGI